MSRELMFFIFCNGSFMRFEIIILATTGALLASCGGGSGDSASAYLSIMDDDVAVGVSIESHVGTGTISVPVRTVNEHGAAVAGGELTLSVDGTGLSITGATVDTGSWGVGLLSVSSGTPTSVMVSLLDWSESDTAPTEIGESWITLNDLSGYPLMDAFTLDSEASFMASGFGGAALAVGPSVVWQPNESGSPQYEVASSVGDIQGMLSIDVDDDGPNDIVAWSESEVLMLRGSSGLGLVWGAGLSTEDGIIKSVAVGDMSGDGLSDVIVSLEGDSGSAIEIFLGDGIWGFSAGAQMVLDEAPQSISYGDFTGTGSGEISALYGGKVVRYRYSANGEVAWLSTGQDLNPVPELLPDSELTASLDVNGDNLAETMIVEPESEGGDQRLVFYTIDNTITFREKIYSPFQYEVSDITGDALADFIILQDLGDGEAELRAITADSTGDKEFLDRNFATLPASGWISTSFLNSDTIPDLLVANNALRVYLGEYPEDGFWTVSDDPMVSYSVDSSGIAVVLDADGAGWKDLIVSKVVNNKLWLYTYNFSNGPDSSKFDLVVNSAGIEDLDVAASGDNAEVIDSLWCPDDDRLYMIIEDSGRWLYSIRVLASSNTDLKGYTAVDADLIACGDFANGADVAAVSYDGHVAWFDANLGDRGVADEEIGALGDVVALDRDGSGDVLRQCIGDCSIDAYDLNGDGLDEVAIGGDSPRFEGFGYEIALGAGEPSFADMDGDGRVDLIMTDHQTSLISVYRMISASLVSPIAFHSRQPMSGSAMASDIDNDGSPELIVPGNSGILFVSPR